MNLQISNRRRIFVLSLQAELLHTYTHPEGHLLYSICCFDGKLLAAHKEHLYTKAKGVIALGGL